MKESDPKKRDLSHLDAQQFAVTQEGATEAPFSGVYVDNKAQGVYRCVVCEAPLFSSSSKYDSGSGWPSFWAAVDEKRVETRVDTSHGMRREEAICASCGAHLGHIFPDGPRPSGTRFCINSASLNFTDSSETTDD